jgi:uncharacterized spore protein YtfJ
MAAYRRGKESLMAVATDERSQLVNDLLERIGQTIGEKAQASAIFGEPVDREGVTVVPVAKARFGFGGGGGGGTSEESQGFGRGGGGGVAVTPIGYIEVRDGGSTFKRISTAADLLALVAAASLALIAVRRLVG